MNEQALQIVQIILGVILIGLILIQAKGAGLGSTFGGDMGFYGTKRGAEKVIFITTIVVSILFMMSSLVRILF